tara:strand:+ start:969 stop:1160 length:192 start_codon:yes stop_codon:yes gene_type:complete
MTDTTPWSVQQAMALNKLLDLIDDIIEREVDDTYMKEKYETRYRKILDVMFPERKSIRNPHQP